jgi:hypothetical protein
MDGQINDALMKDTTLSASLQEQSPQASIQDSVDGDPVQEHLCHLSFQSPEMELQMEYGDDVEQPESTDDNDQDQTPLSGRMRSARAFQSRPLRIVIIYHTTFFRAGLSFIRESNLSSEHCL